MSVMNKEELSKLILENQKEMYVLAYSILKNQADAQDAVSECIVRAFERILKDWNLHHQNFIGISRRWQKFTLPQVPASGRENTAWSKSERFGKHPDRSFRFPL